MIKLKQTFTLHYWYILGWTKMFSHIYVAINVFRLHRYQYYSYIEYQYRYRYFKWRCDVRLFQNTVVRYVPVYMVTGTKIPVLGTRYPLNPPHSQLVIFLHVHHTCHLQTYLTTSTLVHFTDHFYRTLCVQLQMVDSPRTC